MDKDGDAPDKGEHLSGIEMAKGQSEQPLLIGKGDSAAIPSGIPLNHAKSSNQPQASKVRKRIICAPAQLLRQSACLF